MKCDKCGKSIKRGVKVLGATLCQRCADEAMAKLLKAVK